MKKLILTTLSLLISTSAMAEDMFSTATCFGQLDGQRQMQIVVKKQGAFEGLGENFSSNVQRVTMEGKDLSGISFKNPATPDQKDLVFVEARPYNVNGRGIAIRYGKLLSVNQGETNLGSTWFMCYSYKHDLSKR